MATKNQNLSDYSANEAVPSAYYNIALVISQWNSEITESMAEAASKTLVDCGIPADNIKKYYVPGSFELIYACQQVVDGINFDAVIAIGSIIRGETPHFEFVSSAVAQGLAALNIYSQTPVIFSVLTDDNIEQSKARSGGEHGNKGVEAAVTAIKMANLSQQIFEENELTLESELEDLDKLMAEFDEEDEDSFED